MYKIISIIAISFRYFKNRPDDCYMIDLPNPLVSTFYREKQGAVFYKI